MTDAPKQIAAADRLVLTGFDRGSAILEAQGLDMYSEGITDAAYVFRGRHLHRASRVDGVRGFSDG